MKASILKLSSKITQDLLVKSQCSQISEAKRRSTIKPASKQAKRIIYLKSKQTLQFDEAKLDK